MRLNTRKQRDCTDSGSHCTICNGSFRKDSSGGVFVRSGDRVERPARAGERARERVDVVVVSLRLVVFSSPASIGTRRPAPTSGIRWWTVRLSSRVNVNVHALGWSAQRIAVERDRERECERANANLFVGR